jgi:putative oxidoreductase
MRYSLLENQRNELILIARVLLMALFVIFGWGKLTGFSGTVAYMASLGLPIPGVITASTIIMEFFVGIAILIGFYTRPLALLLALYTLVTALIGHQFWLMADAARLEAMINFYKNVSIAGGLLLLCITGPGRYSVDRK